MLNRIKAITGSLLLMATLLAGLVATAPSASAASCYGSSCTGKDPQAQGCASGAVTKSSFVGHWRNNIGKDPYVELRHSGACNARWVRVTAGESDFGCGGGATPQIRIRNYTSGGTLLSEQIRSFSACTTGAWTYMVGRTSTSYKTHFCFRESSYSWGWDSFYHPCKTVLWTA